MHVNLRDGFAPVAYKLDQPLIRVHQSGLSSPLQTGGHQIWLSDNELSICLTLDDSLPTKEVERLAKTFLRSRPPLIRLGRPIMAIQVVKRGLGWPEDLNSGPTALFNCLPAEEWKLMAAERPVTAEHFLLNQPVGTLWILETRDVGPPLSVQNSSIAQIEQRAKNVLVTVDVKSRTELLGHALIRLETEEAAAGLVADLSAGRVTRIEINAAITEVGLYPHANACQGTEVDDSEYLNQRAMLGYGDKEAKASLIYSARQSRPQDVVAVLAEDWKR